MRHQPGLAGVRVHLLFLDTTYAAPKHTLPPQHEAVDMMVQVGAAARACRWRTGTLAGRIVPCRKLQGASSVPFTDRVRRRGGVGWAGWWELAASVGHQQRTSWTARSISQG